MKRLRLALLALALSTTSIARAQPQPQPEPEEPKPDAADEPEASDDEAEGEDPPPRAAGSDVPEEPPKDDAPPPPVLPDPRPDEQGPGPYFPPPEDDPRRQRWLDVGPDFGMTHRTSSSDRVSYGSGFTWGAHLRAELVSFLGIRIYFNNSFHSVDAPPEAFGTIYTDGAVEHDDIKVTVLGARLEPTWVVTPEFRLWVAGGVAWGRVTADEVRTDPVVYNFDRSGVLLEWSGSLGASYDVIPRWAAVTLLLNGGVVSNQSGNVFDTVQVIRQDTGQMERLGGLPKFDNTFSALIGLGIVL